MKVNEKKAGNGKANNRSESRTNGAKINWDSVHERILEGTARLAWMEEEVSTAALQETWARRAVQIAQAVETQDQGEQVEIALVRLGREIYGLEVQYVYEIRVFEHITRVPRVPDWVAGVVNLRGRILSVIDLKRFLGLLPSETAAETSLPPHLVVVEIPEMEVALVADEVLAIETFPASRILDPGAVARGIRAEYLRGILLRESEKDKPDDGVKEQIGAEMDGGEVVNSSMAMILDLPALLSDKRLIIHEEVL